MDCMYEQLRRSWMHILLAPLTCHSCQCSRHMHFICSYVSTAIDVFDNNNSSRLDPHVARHCKHVQLLNVIEIESGATSAHIQL